MSAIKDRVIAFIRSLPEDCSIEQILYHLYTYSRAEEGLRAYEEGEHTRKGEGGGGGGGPQRPDLTLETVLAWMDLHRAREGEWPTADSGEIWDAPGENWRSLDGAL